MRNRDLFLPSLSTVVVFAMSLFISCAHQNRVRDGFEAEGEEAKQEEVAANTEGDATAVTEDANAATATTTEDAAQKADSDLAQLGTEAKPEEAAATQPTHADGDLAALGLNEDGTAKGGDAGTPPTTEAGADGLAPIDPGAAATTASADTSSLESEPTAPKTETDYSLFDEKKSEPKKAAGHRRAHSGHSRVPKIPAKAVTKKGDSLNRFYFVRQGDTPQSVATLIYGNDAHAGKLVKWNGRAWEAGKLVYYASPNEPHDRTMRSFYQERGVTPEEYTVQRGDWLSTIAKQKLGTAKSWKEIAVVNGLASPDSIEVGQHLAIYPQDLNTVNTPKVEEPEKPVEQPVAQAPVQTPVTSPTEEPKSPEAGQPEGMPEPQAQIAPKKAPVAKTQGMDFAKLIEQNIVALVIFGGAVLLLVALASRRKKRRLSAVGDDYNDDFSQGGTPPTKLRRK